MENIASFNHDQYTQVTATRPRVAHRVYNERTAGSMPSWGMRNAPVSQDTQQSFDMVLSSYQPLEPAFEVVPDITKPAQSDEFGFKDLIDMVNPFHHVPVVNYAYRGITGDEIKPIGSIIGGAIFGGGVGAASALVNVIIEEETGMDMMGNATTMVGLTDRPHNVQIAQSYENQVRAQDLSETLLSFAPRAFDAPEYDQNREAHKQAAAAYGRTAGSIRVYS